AKVCPAIGRFNARTTTNIKQPRRWPRAATRAAKRINCAAEPLAVCLCHGSQRTCLCAAQVIQLRPFHNGEQTMKRENTMRLLTFNELAPKKGIPFARTHIRRLVKIGLFPPPIRIGYGRNATVAWPEAEIDEWFAYRIAERDALVEKCIPVSA